MNVFFNESKNKSQKLIDSLKIAIDGRKNYHLNVASCYISDKLSDISTFIDDLIKENIKIKSVNLYIDARQVVKTGTDTLIDFAEKICGERGDDWINIYAVDTPSLFHSKGFALLSEDESSGALVIGSSNFSKSGLFGNTGNFESCLLTNDVDLVNEFLESINNLPAKYRKNLDELEFKPNSPTFRYAIIQEGNFVRKWSGSIQQYFSVKYELTEHGKKQIDGGELKKLGFDPDTDTISRQFLSLEDISLAHTEEYARLLSKGIETHMGHWIPKSISDDFEGAKDLEQFYESLKENIELQIHEKEGEMQILFESLSSQGFIEKAQDPVSMIKEKLLSLKDNEFKIKSFHSKFSVFELPYDFSKTKEIKELYEEIRDVSANRAKKNDAMHRVNSAIRLRNPSIINHDNYESEE